MEKLLTIEETAKLVSLSEVQVRRYISDGRLPSVRFGKRAIRVKPSDLERFVEERLGVEAQPMSIASQCAGLKKDGEPCRAQAVRGTRFCQWHQDQAEGGQGDD